TGAARMAALPGPPLTARFTKPSVGCARGSSGDLTEQGPRGGRAHGRGQQARQRLRRQRPCQQVPLPAVAAELLKLPKLLVALDPLGRNAQLQALRQRDDRPDDRGVTAAGPDLADERAVDLDRVDREPIEVAQG